MGRWSVVVVLALSACGANPEEQCKQAATVSCRRLYECWTTDEDRARLGLGKSADECTKNAQARCTPPSALGPPAKNWDAAAADACITQYAALTCSALKAGATPPGCSNTCK